MSRTAPIEENKEIGDLQFEDHGELAVLHVPHQTQMIGVDFETMGQIWDALESVRAQQKKVLLIHIPTGNLSPHTVDAFRTRVRHEKPVLSFSYGDPCQPLSLARGNNAVSRLLQFLHTLDTLVVVSFEGEVDFDLLGLVLCCDYRICSVDTTFVNRVLDIGVAPGSGALWFLSRHLGWAQTNDIMLEGRSLTADEANKLKLVNRVVPRTELESDSLAVAQRFAEKPASALHTLMHAADFLDHDLLTYMKHIGTGFDRLPPNQQ